MQHPTDYVKKSTFPGILIARETSKVEYTELSNKPEPAQ